MPAHYAGRKARESRGHTRKVLLSSMAGEEYTIHAWFWQEHLEGSTWAKKERDEGRCRSSRRGFLFVAAWVAYTRGTGCKFSSVSKLLAVAMAQGERCIRAWCSEKNAYNSGQA